MQSGETNLDHILVGGGLQCSLLALALLDRRPDARIALIERDTRLGGNHTWSFHAGDVPDGAGRLIDPLIVSRFQGYDVAFPDLRRTLDAGYFSITSQRLHDVVCERFERSRTARVFTGAEAVEVSAHQVRLLDGRVFSAAQVVDARGPVVSDDARSGYQKFVGLELELGSPCGRTRPMLMDACVPQTDGYRFFYVLPFEPRRVLVEDTYFSNTSKLDVAHVRGQVLDYARAQGWQVTSVLREESGVLPLPCRSGSATADGGALLAGYRGGFFHPTTGYSFPIALRLAIHLADHSSSPDFAAQHQLFVREHSRQFRFATLLNRLLFDAMAPTERYRVLERFYRLPQDTIERFYALDTTPMDRARIVCGRPPRGISLRAAFSAGVSS